MVREKAHNNLPKVECCKVTRLELPSTQAEFGLVRLSTSAHHVPHVKNNHLLRWPAEKLYGESGLVDHCKGWLARPYFMKTGRTRRVPWLLMVSLLTLLAARHSRRAMVLTRLVIKLALNIKSTHRERTAVGYD